MTTTLDTTDAKLDVDSLLEPISEALPAGESLAEQGLFRQVEELRREDDPSLPQGVWSKELKRADWPQVVRLCREALESQTKDLYLAVWLTEALVQVEGFVGAAAGMRTLHGLCDRYWDTAHPLPEEDDLGPRLAPLLWLDNKLGQILKRVAVTCPEDGQDSPDLTWNEWEWALHLENLKEADPGVTQQEGFEDKVTKEKFLLSASLSSDTFYQELLAQLEQAEEARGILEVTLERLVGKEAPSFRRSRQILQDIQSFAQRTLRQRAESEELVEDALDAVSEDEGDGEATTGSRQPGAIRSRAEAYRLLNLAADFLVRTEPHSPAPYLVKRAVTWGNMTLIELYKELLEGGADLKSIYRLLGINEE